MREYCCNRQSSRWSVACATGPALGSTSSAFKLPSWICRCNCSCIDNHGSFPTGQGAVYIAILQGDIIKTRMRALQRSRFSKNTVQYGDSRCKCQSLRPHIDALWQPDTDLCSNGSLATYSRVIGSQSTSISCAISSTHTSKNSALGGQLASGSHCTYKPYVPQAAAHQRLPLPARPRAEASDFITTSGSAW